MDKIKSLKVKQADGTFSAAIPFGADAVNVTMADGSTLEDKISDLNGNFVTKNIARIMKFKTSNDVNEDQTAWILSGSTIFMPTVGKEYVIKYDENGTAVEKTITSRAATETDDINTTTFKEVVIFDIDDAHKLYFGKRATEDIGAVFTHSLIMFCQAGASAITPTTYIKITGELNLLEGSLNTNANGTYLEAWNMNDIFSEEWISQFDEDGTVTMADMGKLLYPHQFYDNIFVKYYYENANISEIDDMPLGRWFKMIDYTGELANDDSAQVRFISDPYIDNVNNILKVDIMDINTIGDKTANQVVAHTIATANDLANYYNKTEINDLLGTMSSLKMEVVATLPTENISTSTIYLLPIGAATTGTSSGEETTTAPNAYEEYLYINNTWELIGTTQVDLSGYVTTETFNTEIGSLGNQVGRAQSAADQALSQLENLEVEETEVAISVTEPADEAKIWINPNEDATLTTLSEVAFTGDYNDLINIPSTDTSGGITESQVTEMINSATSNFITSGEVDTKISTATADLVTTSAISKMVTSNSVRRVEAVTEYPSNPEDGVLYIQIAS